MDDREKQAIYHPHVIESDAYSSFLTRSSPLMKRSDSIAGSSVKTTLESITEEEAKLDEEVLSEWSKGQIIGRSMTTKVTNVLDKPGGVLSSAVFYLRGSWSRMGTEDRPIFEPDLKGSRVRSDLFATSLNHCDSSGLADLRLTRAQTAPIICNENDEAEENADIALFLDAMIACGGHRHVLGPQPMKTRATAYSDTSLKFYQETTKNQRADEDVSFHRSIAASDAEPQSE
jgi:hypothetical protein